MANHIPTTIRSSEHHYTRRKTMFLFIIAIISLIIAIALLPFIFKKLVKEDFKYNDDYQRAQTVKFVAKVISAFFGVLFLVMLLLSSIFTQDAGEVKVIKNLGGSLAGYSSDAGFHFKAPWQDIVSYDTRNNVISYVGKGSEDYNGGSANGPQVTINDESGATANIDIQVNYSLEPSAALDLYRDYGKQENFVKSVVAVDVRSIPREQSGKFDTLSMLTKRGDYTDTLEKALKTKWAKLGLNISQVSVQEVRYSKDITNKYAEAQAAEIDKQKAINEQNVAKTEAETKKIEAQGEADANDVLSKSLNDQVLTQKYIDALKNAKNLTVVPDGSTPLIQTQK
jgi:regulator of protease activity HflC (stomatin/prohibitin superfamily)